MISLVSGEIGVQRDLIDLAVGGTAVLSCVYPNYGAAWMFRMELIESKNLILKTNKTSNFILQDATYEHFGMFSCVGHNEENLLYDDVFLRIFGKLENFTATYNKVLLEYFCIQKAY